MLYLRVSAALGLAVVALQMPPAPCAAQPADGKPRLLRVLFDRRVDFPLGSLAFSRDGKRLASLGGTYAFGIQPQYRIVIADVATGRVVREIPLHTTLLNKFVFSPDGKVLYAGIRLDHPHFGGGGGLVVFDVETGKRLKEMPASLWDLSPNGKRLAVVDNWVDHDPFSEGRAALPSTYTLRVHDTATWKELGRLHEENVTMTTLRFSPDGKTLALSVPNYSIRLWDWQARKEKRRFEATRLDEAAAKLWVVGHVRVLEYSPDGTLLASITESPPDEHATALKIDLWDTSSGKRVRSLEGLKTQPTIVAFTPKGDRLAVAGAWNHFRLLDVATGKVVQELGSPGQADLAATLYRDGMTPAQRPGGPALLQRLWDLATGDDTRAGKTLERVQCLAFAPDDRTLAVGDNNGIIHLVDVVTGKELHQLREGRHTVTDVIFLDGGKVLCSQHYTSGIKFWDVQTGKPLPLRLAGMLGSPVPLVASPDGKLAVGSTAGRVLLWNSYKDPRPRVVRCPGNAEQLHFTPDGKKLLACPRTGNMGKVQVIDVATAKAEGAIGPAETSVFGLIPNGPLVATWGHTVSSPWVWDKAVRLWDLSGAARGELTVTPAAYGGVRFTPDGRCMLVDEPGGFGLWEIVSRQVRAHIKGTGPIAQSSDGRLIVSTGPDCLFVWDLTGRANDGARDAGRLPK